LHSDGEDDGENCPPSLRPAASITASARRVALAPIEVPNNQATPARSSPTRRNFVAGLQSTTPWRPADLETLISALMASSSSPVKGGGLLDADEEDDRENGGGGGGSAKQQQLALALRPLLRKGGELTTHERQMTVEEWIYHNAGLAEQKLKRECEAMVAAFEREGMRAMSVLEGLVVE
jgi:hypothetical protein